LGQQLSRPKPRDIVTGTEGATTATGIVGAMIGEEVGMTTTTVTHGEVPGSGSSSGVVTATVTGDVIGSAVVTSMKTVTSRSGAAACVTDRQWSQGNAGAPSGLGFPGAEGGIVMRKALLIAVGLAFAATTVEAQSSRRDDRDGDRWRDDRREWREDRGGRDHDDDGWRDRRFMKGDGGGARFMLRSGDTRLGVVCDTGESMRSCVDAALMLFDKVRQTSPSPSTSTAPPPTSSPR
jgi:hypothetical protein